MTNTLELEPVCKAAAPEVGAGTVYRLEFVDGVRALCALYVVLYHVLLHVWTDSSQVLELPHNPLLGAFLHFLSYGYEAVVVFIVISGFCLMIPVAKGDGSLRGGSLAFFKRRAKRLLPPYYAALMLSIILGMTVLSIPTGSLWDVSIPVRMRDLWSHLFLVHNFTNSSNSINYVLWSIAIEWQIYFAFPLLVLLTRRFGIIVALLTAIVAAFALRTPLSMFGFTNVDPIFLAYFAFGVAAAWVAFRIPSTSKSRLFCSALGITMLVLFPIMNVLDLPFKGICVPIASTALLAYCSLAPQSFVTRMLSFRPLVLIGTFSYSVYMLHPLAIEFTQRFLIAPFGFSKEIEFFVLMPVALAVTLIVSRVFYILIERPCMNSRFADTHCGNMP